MNSFRISYLGILLAILVVGCGTDSDSDNDGLGGNGSGGNGNGSGGSGAGDDTQISVSMRLIPLTVSTGQAAGRQTVESLTEIKLLVEELELENTIDNDRFDFEVNDLIINLPVDGSEVELITEEVRPGFYDELNMEIDYNDDTIVDDPDFIDETDDDDGFSIVVRGIYDGEEFLFRSDEDYDLDLDFNPPLEVTEGSSPDITITIDPSGWFKDAAGNDLDPRNPANYDRIEDNIEDSFDVDDDDDDDDDDD